MGTLLSNGQASKVNAYKSKYQLLAILYLTGSNPTSVIRSIAFGPVKVTAAY